MLQALRGVALPAWSSAFGPAKGEGGTSLSLHGAGAVLATLAGLFGLPILGLRLGPVPLASGPALIASGGSWPLTLAGGFATGLGLGMLSTVLDRRFLSDFGTIAIEGAPIGFGTAALIDLGVAGGPPRT